MSKVTETRRIFAIADDIMLQASRVMYTMFNQDKNSFLSFDSDFADPFGDNWDAKNKEGLEIANDNYYRDKLTEYTSIVQQKMENCRNAFQKSKYFIEKAFPNQPTIWNQFGFNDYITIRNSENNMIKFMEILHNTAQIHQDKLLPVGFTEENINELKVLGDELRNADLDQEVFKKERPNITQQRIIILNECYTFMQKVNKAAKIIFANDYAKYHNYLLPAENTTTTETITEE